MKKLTGWPPVRVSIRNFNLAGSGGGGSGGGGRGGGGEL